MVCTGGLNEGAQQDSGNEENGTQDSLSKEKKAGKERKTRQGIEGKEY